MNARIEHRAVRSDRLPQPSGPYSPAVAFDRLVFVSGQGAKDPANGRLVGMDIVSQTEQVLKNIASILQAAGSSLDHVLRCGVFLTDMSEFAAMNEVYARYFAHHPPARSTVQVSRLPRDVRVEIDLIGLL